MVEKKEDNALREARRRYEEKNKDKRRQASGNFQTMIPKADYDEICLFLKANHITKVQFIKEAYDIMYIKYAN